MAASTACSRARSTTPSGARRWTSASRACDQPGYIIRLVPGSESVQDRAHRNLPAAGRATGPRGIDIDLNGVVWTTLVERPSGELRPPQVQGRRSTARRRRPASTVRKAGRSISIPGPQFKGVDRPRQRQPRLLRLGRPLQHARASARTCRSPTTNGSESLHRAGRRQVRDHRTCPIRWASSPRTSMAASTIRTPAGKDAGSGPRRARARCSTTRAARDAAQGLQGAGAAGPAGALIPLAR